MAVAVFVMICLLCVLAIVILATVLRRRPSESLLPGLLVEQVLVTLVDETTFEGLLRSIDNRSLVLVDASQLSASGDRARVGGELLLPRDRVAYLQKT